MGMRGAAAVPSRRLVAGAAMFVLADAAALLAGAPASTTLAVGAAVLVVAALGAGLDLATSARRWRRAPLRIERRWPQALALGVRHVLELAVVNPGDTPWTLELFDAVDDALAFEGLPRTLQVPARARLLVRYAIVPQRRGPARFGPTQLRLRTRGGCFELARTAGADHALRVYPNFAAVARYAWLAGDRRLAQIGIKSYVRRGSGTDFKQLREYRRGDPVRHIDWKATLRQDKPIVREFEDARDQCVLFLLDCGRRMRADEGGGGVDGGHFDQALNALMLLSYVALKEGDEVGALTFGTPEGQQRHFAPRKGSATLNALMARLHDIEPGTTHSDYQLAAQALMRGHRKRALVIVLTNFRDEDAAELQPALTLMRTRHLVLLASLRERAVRDLVEHRLQRDRDAVAAAAAHLFEQSRRDAFGRVVGADPLAIDVEPGQLAVALVNHYHAVKRARLL
jgi:uncharacterized protein (DUF58 family)